MRLLTETVLLICLALLMVAGEGRTIARCLAAVRGPGVLSRLGAGFLLTEVVLVALAAAVLIAFTTRWPTAPEPFHAGTPLVAVAAVLAVVIVGGLRLAWGTRSLASARFSWPVESPGVPATRKREPAHSARPGHR